MVDRNLYDFKYDIEKFALPFLSWPEYNALVNWDIWFKANRPQQFEQKRRENEHIMDNGCKSCGFNPSTIKIKFKELHFKPAVKIEEELW
jgi:hypothetical protein